MYSTATRAYRLRRAALASSLDTSGATDKCPVAHPVLPDEQRSHRDVPGTHQAPMERRMAVLILTRLPKRVDFSREGEQVFYTERTQQ